MPKLYGVEHIIFLVFFFASCFFVVWSLNKYAKTKQQKTLAINVLAGVLVVAIIINRISLAAWHKNAWLLIPDSFCGLTSLLLGVSVFVIKDKNHGFYHGVLYLATINPLLTIFYPDFIGQASSVWFVPTMSGLIHHAVSFLLMLAFFVTNEFTPSLKKWWYYIFALTFYVTYGLFLIQGLGFEKAMYLDKPLVAGTIFTWYFVGILMEILHLSFLFLYTYITTRKQRNTQS